jgi:hypothetical protein
MLVLHLISMKKDLHKSLWNFMYKLPLWFIEEKYTIANVVMILLILLNHDFQNGNSHLAPAFFPNRWPPLVCPDRGPKWLPDLLKSFLRTHIAKGILSLIAGDSCSENDDHP